MVLVRLVQLTHICARSIAVRRQVAHRGNRWIGRSTQDDHMDRHTSALVLAAACGCLALAACNQAAEEAAEPAALTLHEVMKEQVDANADALWDVTNAAIDDDAMIDPALLDDAKWAQIIDLSGKVEAGARTLAAMDPIVVAAPGVKIADSDIEDGHTAAQVQSFLDADPATFRNLATTLADHMGELRAAAQARDSAKLALLVNQLDGVCESCHLNYWYPEQAEMVRSIRQAGGDDPAPDSAQ
jgi:Cytochrome C'